jgi:proline iminopeptidase
MKQKALLLAAIFIFTSCNKYIESPGAIVPPTASEDAALPQLTVNVQGHSRKLHLQTFGDSSKPPVFVLPGGPGGDFRIMLPLKALTDSFYVVMWDPHGAGLSERVPKEELSFESFIEEIVELKKQLSPNKKISLIGHSYGGLFISRYTSEHPTDVDKLILIEPGGLNRSRKSNYNGGAVSFLDGQEFFWTNELLTSTDHAAADYKAIDLLPKASRNFTCNNTITTNYPMWRFGAYQYYIVTKNERQLPGNYNWANGIQNFSGHISIIAGTCGAASESFQRNTNVMDLPTASIQIINGAGHLTLFTEYSSELLKDIRIALR